MDAIVNDQYKTFRSVVQGCLDDHRMQFIEPHEKEGFPSLKRMLHALQSKKLPRKLGIRARRERRVVRTIVKILRQRLDITVRRTDKSKVFNMGNATVFAEKASKYMIETEAYEEISNERCVLSENLQLPNTPRRPIVAAIHAPATQVSKFLNDLLAPVFLRVARETTFINGIDLVRALEKYVANGHIKTTTLFITFDVENLYTMIPWQGALEALMQFLERHLHQQADNELYGRYIDDVFMTTNLAFDQVKERLENANRKEPNIRISYSIHSRVDFLDVTISNDDGQLKTSIFQKPAAEPYVLPYTSDHPRHVYHNIPYSALLRAVRICSDVEDFDMEHVRIDLS
ncbi:unnamed protein product [Rotaria sp. Silwood1]|nr:unnamed protein product [Rotaria sp. Silwood1]CAF4784296.1 unnamed protein product [Rotaria sp. Silwood1]